MQRLEVSGAVRPIYRSLGVKRLRIYTSATCVPLRSKQYLPQQLNIDSKDISTEGARGRRFHSCAVETKITELATTQFRKKSLPMKLTA